ncbi:MAG: SUF system Fe-S cluster assembly regulator [Bdellovibrionales bacterium]
MIKVSKLADYAVVVLAALAARDGKAVPAAELSQITGLPQPTVAKVLKQLAKAGIIDSARGVQGGYTLVADSKELSVETIITAIDGPVRVTECADNHVSCMASDMCQLHGRWAPVNRALKSALASVSLADLMRRASVDRAA